MRVKISRDIFRLDFGSTLSAFRNAGAFYPQFRRTTELPYPRHVQRYRCTAFAAFSPALILCVLVSGYLVPLFHPFATSPCYTCHMARKLVLCILPFLSFLSSSPLEDAPLDLFENTSEIVYSPTMFTGTQDLFPNTTLFAPPLVHKFHIAVSCPISA